MIAYVRPEAIALSDGPRDETYHSIGLSNGSAGISGRIISRSFLGPLTRVVVDTGPSGLVQVDLASGNGTAFTPGIDCIVSLAIDEVLLGPSK